MNVALAPAAPGQPYDPHYDPLVEATPGLNRDYAPTYWVATAGTPPADDGPVGADMDADVVVVGSGQPGALPPPARRHAKFPALRGIEVDYSWWGWVDVSHDMMPRIVQPDPAEPLFYAVGYGGNGVSYSAQAGRRLAELVAGRPARHAVPIFKGELPGHPFAPFRRLGQRMPYQACHRRDERPD